MTYHSSNPIFQDKHNKKWYFWDETWSDSHGPFETQEEAEQKCSEYTKKILEYEQAQKEEEHLRIILRNIKAGAVSIYWVERYIEKVLGDK